jgi:hypothetical protein
MSRESERLRARVRQIRRAFTPPEGASPAHATPTAGPDADQVADLRARVAHLEQLVQGLQDSVYRESHRQEKRLTDLELRLDPTELAAALSKNARERGL